MQLYDIKEDKGYPEPEIVPDELGDYYLAEEVDKKIAALNAELKKYKAFWEQSRLADRQAFEIYPKGGEMLKTYNALIHTGQVLSEWADVVIAADHERVIQEKDEQITDLKEANSSLAGAAIEKPPYKADLIEQISTLTEELRLSGLRGDSLDRVIEEGVQKELVLEAEVSDLRGKLQGEQGRNDSLGEQVDALTAENEATLGVGNGTGQMFVHGKYEAIKLLQGKLLRMETLTAENSALREQNSAMNASLVELSPEVERLKKDRCGKQWGCLLYVPTKQAEGGKE